MIKNRPRLFVWVALVLASLACQAVAGVLQPTPTPWLQSAARQFDGPASPTPTATATATPTFTPSPSPTPLPSATPTPSPSPTIVPTPSAKQLRIFEKLWKTVRDEYLYPDFNGLDWEAIHAEYQQKIQAGLTRENFYAALHELIFRLGDDHSVYLSPEMVESEEAEFAGENDYVGIGVLTSLVPERKVVTIIVVFGGSPADEAGLKSHDNILAVDGESLVDEDGNRRDLLRGPENTSLELTVQTPGQESRKVQLTRKRVTGAAPVPFSVLTSAQGRRIGYILLTTFADETVDDSVEAALRAMSAETRLDGLILDNRQNGGGADSVTRNILGFFTSGSMGRFVDRNNKGRTFQVMGADILGSFKLPLVVLVGKNTVSFGEIFSGVLQDRERAYLIGDVTDGNVELLWGYGFEDGSRVWLAREVFKPARNSKADWEANGVQPDLIVPSNWDEVTLETDPAVLEAMAFFDKK